MHYVSRFTLRKAQGLLFHISRFPFHGIYLLLILGALWLIGLVGDTPLAPAGFGGLLRGDALSAFFALLTLLAALVQLILGDQRPLRTLLVTLALLGAYAVTELRALAFGYLLATLCTLRLEPGGLRDKLRALRTAQGAILQITACFCLVLAITALWMQAGTWRYDLPSAGAGLTSFVFWFIFLATFTQFWILDVRLLSNTNATPSSNPILSAFGGVKNQNLILTVAWFYPLMRLYSLGPWNLGWLLAVLLIGGAAALWAAWQALASRDGGMQPDWLVQTHLSLALAGIGLGSGIGVAAACYALLVVLLLALGLNDHKALCTADQDKPNPEPGNLTLAALQTHYPQWGVWMLSGILPLTAPFVSAWMAIGAAAAGSVWLLAGSLWLAAFLAALALIRTAGTITTPPGSRLRLAALLSAGLGVAAPGIVQMLIIPVTQQLQGGLTPFGDINLWPWGGLIALDTNRQQAAALPSIALFVLMLVLSALVWLVMRLMLVWADWRRTRNASLRADEGNE
ncbi:MAG: hypothetical protein MI924_39335 [Chloroflexales bacterium]|nr:hypothetical protein [Chloroflexales bacterium]